MYISLYVILTGKAINVEDGLAHFRIDKDIIILEVTGNPLDKSSFMDIVAPGICMYDADI